MRNQLNDMSIFVEVARSNGFRAAAEKLKLSAGSVSEAIQRFEDRLGVRLFDRTTRKVSLTPVGEYLYERSLPAIQDLESAVREINDHSNDMTGTLVLSAPRSAGPLFLDELLTNFVRLYPDLSLEIIYDDQKVDLVTSGVDAVIRSQTLLEEDTHATPIGPSLEMAIVGTADYLNRKGVPSTPKALLSHDGICFSFGRSGQTAPWLFSGELGQYSVMPRTKVVVNDVPAMLNYALSGIGLAYIYKAMVTELINNGGLQTVLSDKLMPMPRYTINYLSKRNMSTRLRAFIDFAKQPVRKNKDEK